MVPHRIRRQTWQVRCASKTTAFHLRQRLRDGWEEILLPAFAAAFDHEFGGEEIIHLKTINLCLKVAPDETVLESLAEMLREQLVRQVRELAINRPRLGREGKWKSSRRKKDQLETLLGYLRTGTVAWEAASNDAPSLAKDLRETCREQWPRVQTLLKVEPPSAEFYFRLLQLIAPADVDQAIGVLVDKIPPPLKPLIWEVLHLLREPAQRYLNKHGQLQLSALLLSEVISRRESWIGSDFVLLARRYFFESAGLNSFLASLPAASATLFQNRIRDTAKTGRVGMARSSLGSVNPSVRPKQNATAFTWGIRDSARSKPEDAENVSPTSSHAVHALPRHPLERIGNPIADGSMASGKSADQTSLSKMARLLLAGTDTDDSFVNQPKAAADFPLRVTHAGLVLLHPFLSRLFASTGFKAGSKAELSSFVLPRASALLHFLATGRDSIYEYDTTFIKVLLGVDPEMPLCVSDGLLVDTDKFEAEALLRAAITHWSVLKATSIEGFRASFLQRHGSLREGDMSWKLQIERGPFDMLLEHLPWSIGVVKLPWMARPLYTDW